MLGDGALEVGGPRAELVGRQLRRRPRVSAATARHELGPIVGPGLRILFVGINPSLRSAEVGHHFARPGNRFWSTLHAAGFTPRRLRPDEDAELPAFGIGLVVAAPLIFAALGATQRAGLIVGVVLVAIGIGAWVAGARSAGDDGE